MEGLNMNRPNSYNFTLIITGTIGLAAAAYIFLADFIPRKDNLKKKTYKKGILPGLENRGNTCFVNCILQALSSCYSFSTWLESAARHKPYPPLLLQSLDNIIKVLNCQTEESTASAYQVLKALRSHGWVISSEEQDAHELFHALTSTLDDEILLLRKENSSLLNVSWVNTEQCNEIFSTNFCKSSMNSSLTKQLLTHSEQLKPRFSQKDEYQKDISIISKVTSSLQQDSKKIDRPAYESPFKGYLASNLQCSVCGLKNAEQLSTFESISLSLSLSSWTLQKSLLLELLDAFVRPETVSDVSCDGCSKANDCPSRTTFSKQLTIRKLPDCLCIHVKRTIWMGNGCVVKRNDFVEFPEVLNMDPYTYSVRVDHRQTLNGGLVGGRQSAATSWENCDKATSDANNSRLQFESCTPSQLKSLDSTRIPWKPHSFYKLRSVVVHVGDVFSGHFVTYRRGGLNTNMRERWFYTSDIVVREVSIEEVLQSNAYMLLYERYKI